MRHRVVGRLRGLHQGQHGGGPDEGNRYVNDQRGGAAAPAGVTVSHGRTVLRAEAGVTVSFGRRDDCDLVLPPDDFISRHAGDVEVRADRVIVWNRSSTKPLVVRPFAGQDVVLEPGEGHAPGTEDFDVFDVVLSGRAGAVVSVHVDARALVTGPPVARPAATGTTQTRTHRAEIGWKPYQHRVLVALCEPLFTRRGADAAPATYQQIAARLGLQPAYVRNVVRGIRDELTALGLPGLSVDDDTSPQGDLRVALAQWARRHRWVTVEDVDRLDEAQPTQPVQTPQTMQTGRSGGTRP